MGYQSPALTPWGLWIYRNYAYNSLPSFHPPSLFCSFSLCFLHHLYLSLPTHGSLSSLFLVPHTHQSPAPVESIIMHTSQSHMPFAVAYSENLRLTVVSMCVCTGGRQSLSFARKHFGANSSILGMGSYLENSRSSCSSPAFHPSWGKPKKFLECAKCPMRCKATKS